LHKINSHILALIILLVPLISNAQNKTLANDSLRRELHEANSADDKVQILFQLIDYYELNNLDSAVYYAEQALATTNFEDKQMALNIQNKLGIIYNNRGEYSKAVFHFLEGLKIAEQLQQPKAEIIFLVNIGAIYDRQNDFETAEKYYLQAKELVINSPDLDSSSRDNYLANIYNNLANVHGDKQDTITMMFYYDKALNHVDFKGSDYIKSVIYNNVARIQLEKYELKKAYKNISKSLELRINLHDLKGQSQCYRNLGFYYFKKHSYDSSIYSFNESIKLAKKVGSLIEVVESSKGISKVYERIGNIDSAFSKFKNFKYLSDSLYNEKRANEIARIASNYKFEKEQALIHLNQRKKELRFYIILGIMLVTTIIFGLFVIILQSRIKNSKLTNQSLELKQKSLELEKDNLNLTLDHKNREMTTKVLYLYQKNELVDNVISQLKELQINVKSENKPIVKKVIKNLSEVINQDSWKEFELRFNEVHQEFYNKLETQFPELTPNEHRLCAFLKLNMTSKEISSLTGQSNRSVDVARTRLRKKLMLTNTETGLVEFLLGL